MEHISGQQRPVVDPHGGSAEAAFLVVGGGGTCVSAGWSVLSPVLSLTLSLAHATHSYFCLSISLSLCLCVSLLSLLSLCLPLLLSLHSVQSSLFCGEAAHRPPLELKDFHRAQRLCEEEGWVALVLRCQHTRWKAHYMYEYNNTYTQQRDTSTHGGYRGHVHTGWIAPAPLIAHLDQCAPVNVGRDLECDRARTLDRGPLQCAARHVL